MPDDKTIQIKCSEEFKKEVEDAAKKDRRSVSSYGKIAIEEKMREVKITVNKEFLVNKSCENCGTGLKAHCDACTGFSWWTPRNF